MKKLILVMICIMVAGCGGFSDEVKFVQSYKEIDTKYDEAMAKFDNVSGDNYTSDKELHDVTKNEVIPIMEELSVKMDSIQFESDTYNDIHDKRKLAHKAQLEAMYILVEAIEIEDASKVHEINAKIEQAKELYKEYKKDLVENTDLDLAIESKW